VPASAVAVVTFVNDVGQGEVCYLRLPCYTVSRAIGPVYLFTQLSSANVSNSQ